MYLPTRVKSGRSRFTCVLYAGLAKGGFFNSKSGCVLYADATYTRVYTVVDAPPGGSARTYIDVSLICLKEVLNLIINIVIVTIKNILLSTY